MERAEIETEIHAEEPVREEHPPHLEPAEQPIVGVRFQEGGKIYSFLPGSCSDLIPGDFVVVDTAWGRQIGRVVFIQYLPPEQRRDDLKTILRRATGADLALRQQWEEKAREVLQQLRERAFRQSMPVKFATAEYTLDGKRLTILYETEGKVDLEELRQELAANLQTQVEMRQIGPRDRAKLLGGYGACGELRCCSRFLAEFNPVSIRMGKAQGISLTPSDITGMCGRLRCCLAYEYETYQEALQRLPKLKSIVRTPRGVGKVVDLAPLKGTVIVQIEDQRVEVPAGEIEVLPKDSLQSVPKEEA
ncbi:MAG: regulatory iron-sulfur-containing complex subunit RicT [Anaerolineae bacterium]|nr:stage 0 sporulation protein [Anaerolineae bacterium]MDW8067993.1 regulatory iron-sulfur-containing complex subunit RicT [Anaerolineae bacterium]